MKNIKAKSPADWMREMPSSSKVFPSFHVDEREMPEIDGWEVGKEYVLNIKVKMTNKDEYSDGRDTCARLEVLAYEDKTPKDDNDPSTPKKAGGLPDSI
jgi:hypothetical protein